jgi:hypothetical protein
MEALGEDGVKELFLSTHAVQAVVDNGALQKQLSSIRLAWNQAHPEVSSPLLESLCGEI